MTIDEASKYIDIAFKVAGAIVGLVWFSRVRPEENAKMRIAAMHSAHLACHHLRQTVFARAFAELRAHIASNLSEDSDASRHLHQAKERHELLLQQTRQVEQEFRDASAHARVVLRARTVVVLQKLEWVRLLWNGRIPAISRA
jgi:hypothetical protein